MSYRRIVVGTDGSETASRALEKAVRLAKRVGGQLTLVCASAPIGLTDDVAEDVLRYARDEARREGVEAETVLKEGAPAKVMLDVAEEEDADLIVVGNLGMGKARRFALGPVPERVAREAPCDVLIAYTKTEAAEDGEAIYKRILVGTDGSPTASEAARKAFDLAMMFGIGVTLVYVAGDPIVGAIVLEQTAKSKPRALGVEQRLVEGEPAEKICEVAAAEGVDLIVIGNKGMTGARRYLLGSVPSQVAHAAPPSDVLIAKTVDRTVDDLAPGHGGVVRDDGRRLAVYRAEDGSLSAFSPRCAHMGCTVDWNDAEKTWDCPCHGSRYSHDGNVIQGPAEKGLTPEDLTAG
jgi:nucleotide-binding universal stress UspA family protein